VTSLLLVLCVLGGGGHSWTQDTQSQFDDREMKFKDADCEDMYKTRIGSSGVLY